MKNSIIISVVEGFECNHKSLKEVITYLQEIESMYPNSYFSYNYNWEYTRVDIKYNREETDEEYSIRLQEDTKKKKRLKQQKVNQLEKLQKELQEI